MNKSISEQVKLSKKESIDQLYFSDKVINIPRGSYRIEILDLKNSIKEILTRPHERIRPVKIQKNTSRTYTKVMVYRQKSYKSFLF
jgi:hypothetical protein